MYCFPVCDAVCPNCPLLHKGDIQHVQGDKASEWVALEATLSFQLDSSDRQVRVAGIVISDLLFRAQSFDCSTVGICVKLFCASSRVFLRIHKVHQDTLELLYPNPPSTYYIGLSGLSYNIWQVPGGGGGLE